MKNNSHTSTNYNCLWVNVGEEDLMIGRRNIQYRKEMQRHFIIKINTFGYWLQTDGIITDSTQGMGDLRPVRLPCLETINQEEHPECIALKAGPTFVQKSQMLIKNKLAFKGCKEYHKLSCSTEQDLNGDRVRLLADVGEPSKRKLEGKWDSHRDRCWWQPF